MYLPSQEDLDDEFCDFEVEDDNDEDDNNNDNEEDEQSTDLLLEDSSVDSTPAVLVASSYVQENYGPNNFNGRQSESASRSPQSHPFNIYEDQQSAPMDRPFAFDGRHGKHRNGTSHYNHSQVQQRSQKPEWVWNDDGSKERRYSQVTLPVFDIPMNHRNVNARPNDDVTEVTPCAHLFSPKKMGTTAGGMGMLATAAAARSGNDKEEA